MEEAEGYKTLIEQYDMTQEQAAQRVGKSRSAVTNAMRLLQLDPEIRALVESDQLSAGHSDDTAICESADKGWGWLAKRGFDFIQTDWTAAMTKYLSENGLLHRKSK